jgi:hypothetical protein
MATLLTLLGAFGIALGLAMAGMRAGYWLLVVGIKSVVLLAIIATTVVWYVGNAHAITQSQFTALYNAAAKQATTLGVYPKRLCFPGYCANQMAFIAPTGETVFLTNGYKDNGSNVQELCIASRETPDLRICATSEGKRAEESWNGKKWDIIKTITDHFDW